MSTTTNPSEAGLAIRIRVGLFTALGLLLLGAITVFVNDRPYWWRPCSPVHIQVEDATGLKTKSPVKSLGLHIGYLRSVQLSETRVRLGICITAPVEVLPDTRAYIRGDGFLGDKFVELKPVRYTGDPVEEDDELEQEKTPASEERKKPEGGRSGAVEIPSAGSVRENFSAGTHVRDQGRFSRVWNAFSLIASAHAETTPLPAPSEAVDASAVALPTPSPRRSPRKGEIPVGESQDMQQLIQQVDKMVFEMTSLTNNLRESLNPQDLKVTIQRLNSTLENASRTLSPEGGLNQTAQRSLAKLEDAIEQMRDMMARVNRGEGSVGMLLNDPSYAEEIRKAIQNVNVLLGRAGGLVIQVRIAAEQVTGGMGGRGYGQLTIQPAEDRYYLLGAAIDPRGSESTTTTVTTVDGGDATTTVEQTKVQGTGGSLQITLMFGKVLWKRLDLAIGALHGDGALTTALRFGPSGREEMFVLRNDLYTHSSDSGFDNRLQLQLRPFLGWSDLLAPITLTGGLEGIRQTPAGSLPLSYGAGVTFSDEDIKLLFALL